MPENTEVPSIKKQAKKTVIREPQIELLTEKVPYSGTLIHSKEVVNQRIAWLKKTTGVELRHASNFSEPTTNYNGNIENLIGVSQIPVGIAGPLKVNGDWAQGLFYVPLATTEGVLVHSFHRGSRVITKSGGANTRVLSDKLHVDPIFLTGNLAGADKLIRWTQEHFDEIRGEAEKTTRHGKLVSVDPKIVGNKVVLRFSYTTGDAMGMNMVNIATDRACRLIAESLGLVDSYYPRSNYSSDKKISMHGLYAGYGKEVFAEAILTREAVRLLQATPEAMYRYYLWQAQASTHAIMIGQNGHVVNGITALFIATGQDVAETVHSSAAISSCELMKDGSLYTSVYLPNLLVGTVGGGTRLGTAKECLQIMDCYGPGKSKKFAEIIAATVLAGEISILASQANHTFIKAHELFARQPRNNKCSE